MKQHFAAVWFAVLCASLACFFAADCFSYHAEKTEGRADVYFADQADLIDLNTAPVSELELLPGIGREKAESIELYRRKNHSFSNVKELTRIKGISEGTIRKIAPFIADLQPHRACAQKDR